MLGFEPNQTQMSSSSFGFAVCTLAVSWYSTVCKLTTRAPPRVGKLFSFMPTLSPVVVCVAAVCAAVIVTPVLGCPFQNHAKGECAWPVSAPVSVSDIRTQFERACFGGPAQEKLNPVLARAASRELDDEVRERLHLDTTLCGPLAEAALPTLMELWGQRLKQQRALLYKSARATWNLFVAALQAPFPDKGDPSRPDAWLASAAARLFASTFTCADVHFVPIASNTTVFEVVPSPCWDSVGPLVAQRLLGNRVGFCVGDRLDLADALAEVFGSRGVGTLVEQGTRACPYYVVLPVLDGRV